MPRLPFPNPPQARWIFLALLFVLTAFSSASAQPYLQSTALVSDPPESTFGAIVAANDNTIVVGNGGNWSANPVTYSAYVFARGTDGWVQQQKLTVPAGDLAIDGDTLVAGGVIYVRSGSTWTEQYRVTTNETPTVLQGNTLVLGNVWTPTSDNGSVQIYVRNGTTWTQQAVLPPHAGSEMFGDSVALDGDTLVVGTNRTGSDERSPAYVYVRNGTTWTQQGTLSLPNQGWSTVAIEGDTAVVGDGAYYNRVGIFTRSGGTWTLTQTLSQPRPADVSFAFGSSVTLKNGVLVVGARSFSYIYVWTPSGWTLAQAIDQTVTNNALIDGGKVFLAGQLDASGAGHGRVNIYSEPPAATAGWSGRDIGNPGQAGTDDGSPPAVTMTAGGADIFGTADSFHFLSLPAGGDVSVVAHVAAMTNTNPWAKAGVMIRSSLGADASNAAMLLTAGNVCVFQARTIAGGATSSTSGGYFNAPYWVKLTRTGNTFTGYISPDGATWTQVGAQDLAMSGAVYVGLAGCAHAPGVASTISFDNTATSVAGAGGAPPTPPGNATVNNVTYRAVHLAWEDNSNNEDGFDIYAELTGPQSTGPYLAGLVAANATSYDVRGLQADSSYLFSVVSRRGGAESSPSSVAAQTAQAQDQVPYAPTNLALQAVGVGTLQLTWTDPSTTEDGFEIQRATDGSSFGRVATVGANVTSFSDSGLSPGTTYTYRVHAWNWVGYSAYSNVVSGTAATEPPLPSGWTGHDVGSPAVAGSDSALPPRFTMQAAGTDIYGTADSFHYQFETVQGDAIVVCRVASLGNTDPWAKAGVMIRGTLSADSPNAAMLLTAGNACAFQVRATAGGATASTSGGWFNAPYWVKLTRVGNILTGYVSPDGTTWTRVGSSTVVLPPQIYIGFAGCSHNASASTTIVFEQAGASGTIPPSATAWTEVNWNGASGRYTTDGNDTPTSVTATSGDIYDTADSGVFVYRPWTGDATFIARLDAVGNSDSWAKAGLMFRAGLEPAAANAFVALTPGVGAIFQSRTPASGTYTTLLAHNWTPGSGSLLKLERSGGTISAAFSVNNGTTWTPLGSITDDFPATIYLGYAASSHNPSASTTATFAKPN